MKKETADLINSLMIQNLDYAYNMGRLKMAFHLYQSAVIYEEEEKALNLLLEAVMVIVKENDEKKHL